MLIRQLTVLMKLAMPVLYLAVGLMVLTTQLFGNLGSYRILLGILLIGYGIFRGYRIIRDRNESKQDEMHED